MVIKKIIKGGVMEKPNCFKCKYRGKVPGSAHSSCKHPDARLESADPMVKMMAIFASVGRTPPIMQNTEKMGVKGNPHGISKGWFNHPFNFDPVWLEECNGFTVQV